MNAPPSLARRVWAPLLVLVLLAGALTRMLAVDQPLVQTRTSYGGIPAAWGAAFDLLEGLGLRPLRTRAPLRARDLAQAQWIIEPEWHPRDLPYELAAIARFVERGGTVVLIGASTEVLEGLGFGAGLREAGGDADVPGAGGGPGALDADGADAAPGGGKKRAGRAEPEAQRLHGAWLRRPRRARVSAAGAFAADAVPEDEVRVRSRAGVFALERARGRGKLAVLSDASFLTNAQLGEHDHAALLVDLARALGTPTFDERCHGLMPERSPWAVFGPGFVLLAALSFTSLALGVVLYARRWPARRAAGQASPPSLELFVGSLAALYRARGRSEPAAVFRAYRAGFVRRIARSLHELPEAGGAGGPSQRLARQATQAGLDARWLAEAAAPSSPRELATAVAALERYAAAAQGERER